MSREVIISLISVVVGALLALISTVGYDAWKDFKEEKKQNEALCRKLLEEIRYNIKKAQSMELTGKFTPFRIDEWLNFTGSSAFYKLSNDTKRTLDSFYTILRFNNDELIKNKKLEEKAKGEMTVEVLTHLIDPFLEYLVRNKIISIADATLQWHIPDEIKKDVISNSTSK